MDIKGLGKITVTTAGTPVPLSASTLRADQVIVSFDPADTSAVISIKDESGNKILSMALGNDVVILGGGSGVTDVGKLFADSSVSGKGPIIGYIVD